jgi:hypothetical protein
VTYAVLGGSGDGDSGAGGASADVGDDPDAVTEMDHRVESTTASGGTVDAEPGEGGDGG